MTQREVTERSVLQSDDYDDYQGNLSDDFYARPWTDGSIANKVDISRLTIAMNTKNRQTN